VLDRGHMIAEGTSAELKRQVAGRTLVLYLADPKQISRASEELRGMGAATPDVREEQGERVLALEVGEDISLAAQAIRRLGDAGLELADLRLQQPTLDEVFFALTGQAPAAHANGDREQDSR
jgi:ABC-2 type transport system ATP-binding protein